MVSSPTRCATRRADGSGVHRRSVAGCESVRGRRKRFHLIATGAYGARASCHFFSQSCPCFTALDAHTDVVVLGNVHERDHVIGRAASRPLARPRTHCPRRSKLVSNKATGRVRPANWLGCQQSARAGPAPGAHGYSYRFKSSKHLFHKR